MLPRLKEPPTVTWAFHTALVRAAVQHHLPRPELGALAGVDNLHLQLAIAEL